MSDIGQFARISNAIAACSQAANYRRLELQHGERIGLKFDGSEVGGRLFNRDCRV
jgi:hypothetical protein